MKFTAFSLVLASIALPTNAFTPSFVRFHQGGALNAIPIPTPLAEGDRVIVDGPDGNAILVANVKGEYFATDATCPHLGLPMKKGKINENGPGGAPELQCNFHNSCFNMKTGACNKWVTGALGVQSGFISGIMRKVGREQKDIKAYTVVVNEDGSVVLE